MYTTKQDSRVSWLAQTRFAAFGNKGSPFDETEQLSRLTSPPQSNQY